MITFVCSNLIKLLCVPDMNECDMHKGGCDQVCVNTIGSFHCECEEGYSMMGDGTTCRGKIQLILVRFNYVFIVLNCVVDVFVDIIL